MSGLSPRASLDRPALADNEDPRLCYLLFAGSQRTPQGGLGDLVAAFTSEVAAREAFRQLRLSQTSASCQRSARTPAWRTAILPAHGQQNSGVADS
jgi:hypothetical protein